ncbi:unnamed protein product [Sphagnum jensenii]|uniref:Uncharacterized protein n=1 Tax=Sphagnum jensenii TaxID=128206 RepID=A0ABP1AQK9_9BRYO
MQKSMNEDEKKQTSTSEVTNEDEKEKQASTHEDEKKQTSTNELTNEDEKEKQVSTHEDENNQVWKKEDQIIKRSTTNEDEKKKATRGSRRGQTTTKISIVGDERGRREDGIDERGREGDDEKWGNRRLAPLDSSSS